MNLFLLIITVIASFIIVRVGAIALELTGLDREQARFQSLSSFTGTGFTTKEAELIVGHRQRRNIVSVLMILGKVGIVSLIATFANSLRTKAYAEPFKLPFVVFSIPGRLIPYVNFTVIILVLYIVFRILIGRRFVAKLTKKIRKKLIEKNWVQAVPFEEILLGSEGYGISRIELLGDNPLIGKTLSEADLRENEILVLSVERDGSHHNAPPANLKFREKDKVICYGKIENLRRYTYSPEDRKKSETAEIGKEKKE